MTKAAQQQAQYPVIPIYKEAGYLIETCHVTDEDISTARDSFMRMVYNDTSCNRCDNRPNRHNETCDTCESFMGRRDMAKIVTLNKRTFLSLPLGATSRVREYLQGLGLNYKGVSACRTREQTPVSRRIRLTPPKGMALRPWQNEATEIARQQKRGVIKAPPRSGKTLWATAFIARMGTKALILAGQRDWLTQFRETFLGSETDPAWTDATPDQVNFCKTLKDFQSTDVCLATFQQFMNPNGRKLLEKIRRMFHVVIVDEVHTTPSVQTARVAAQFASEYRFGLTGTPARKQENLYEIAEDLFGKVIYSAKVDTMKPTVDILETGLTFEISNGNFTSFVNKLEYHPKRTKMLVDEAVKRIREGHMVIIPMLRTKAIDALVKGINLAMDEKVAAPFYGGLNKKVRDKTRDAAKIYEIKCIVGNTKLAAVSLNIPRASCLIEAAPSANLVNCEQRSTRILTPMTGKPAPLIVYVLDKSGPMQSMRRGEYWQCVHKKLSPQVLPHARQKFYDWLGGKGGSSARAYEPETTASGRLII